MILNNDLHIHDWYRFVLSFPPQLVRRYLTSFGVTKKHRVLDPFCGTGTTNVECKLLGIQSIGIETNPFPFFASCVKTTWKLDVHSFIKNSEFIEEQARKSILQTGIDDSGNINEFSRLSLRSLPEKAEKLLINDSISPLPKHKAIILLEMIRKYSEPEFKSHFELAFAKALVKHYSNLSFGPEVGVGKIRNDAQVVKGWKLEIEKMGMDISQNFSNNSPALIYQIDSRDLSLDIENQSVDFVITSPPYPNEKDYTRTTRLESVFLGFINSREELRDVKKSLVRSNTRGVYVEDNDFQEILDIPEIVKLSDEIEMKRIELNKSSGFEKQYSKVTKNYFGGMALHLKNLRQTLKPGAICAYVVGDQASYFRVLIKTGKILGLIAQKYGYQVVRKDLFRTRLATSTKSLLREEVLILRWPA